MLLISYNAQNRPAAESWLSSQRIINSAELRNPASDCEGTLKVIQLTFLFLHG